MTISIVQSLSLADAHPFFPLLSSLLSWRLDNMPSDQAVAVVVPEADRPRDLGVEDELLLLVLPDDLQEALPALAAQDFSVYNCDSADLLSRQTLLALLSEHVSVEVDAWQLGGFPGAYESGRFYVGFVAQDRFLLARHDLGCEGMEALIGELQGACISSGPNYRPMRCWSEEELDRAAAGAVEATDAACQESGRRVECHVVSFG